jgi:membrane protease YdiL (CAAX protease family)
VLRAVAAGVPLGGAIFGVVAGRLPRPRRPERRERPLLAAVAVSAAVEEVLWRGLTLRLLRRAGSAPAVLATSAGFAAAHRPHAEGQALATHALLAGVLGCAALHAGGLVTAAIAHATYDVLVLLDMEPP